MKCLVISWLTPSYQHSGSKPVSIKYRVLKLVCVKFVFIYKNAEMKFYDNKRAKFAISDIYLDIFCWVFIALLSLICLLKNLFYILWFSLDTSHELILNKGRHSLELYQNKMCACVCARACVRVCVLVIKQYSVIYTTSTIRPVRFMKTTYFHSP